MYYNNNNQDLCITQGISEVIIVNTTELCMLNKLVIALSVLFILCSNH